MTVVPALALLFKFPTQVAIGTSLVVAAYTSISTVLTA